MDQLLATLDTDKAAIVRQYVKNVQAANRRVANKGEQQEGYSSSDSLDLDLENSRDCRPEERGSQRRVAVETASVNNLLEQAEHVLSANRGSEKGIDEQRSTKMSESPGESRGRPNPRENGDQQEDTYTFKDLPRRSDEHGDSSARKKKGPSKLKSRKSAPGAMTMPSYTLNPTFSPVSALSTPPQSLHKTASSAQPERLRSHRLGCLIALCSHSSKESAVCQCSLYVCKNRDCAAEQ